MSLDDLILERRNEAEGVVALCEGPLGFWAGPTEETVEQPGYKRMYWTRDLARSIQTLLDLGHGEKVRDHLYEIKLQQQADGSIPTLYHDEGWEKRKFRLALKDPWRFPQYTWKKFLQLIGKFSTHSYTSHTTDSGLQYILACGEFKERDQSYFAEHEAAMRNALAWTENNVIDGLYRGADWRDNIRFPENVALLSNNVMLYRAYCILGETEKAERLKQKIKEVFWNGNYYADQYTEQDGRSSFDLLGQSLAVQFGIVDSNQYGTIVDQMERMITPFGLRVNDRGPPLDRTKKEKRTDNRVNQYNTIWDIGTGEGIVALEMMKEEVPNVHDVALNVFTQWTHR